MSAGFADEGLRVEDLVAHAVRAPSGHNSQPWRFEVEDGRLLLRPDRTRALPVVDPDDRELTISCGAALGHLRVALHHSGHEGDVSVPARHDLLATIRPGERTAPREADLFAAIADRVTDRGPYAAREAPGSVLDRLALDAAAEGAQLHVLAAQHRQELTELVVQGDLLQHADAAFRHELAAWMRPNHRGGDGDGMPGRVHGLGTVAARLAPHVMRHADLGAGQARRDRALADAAPTLAVLTTRADITADWVAAGQALSTVALRAAALGVSLSYLNQPVEVAALRPRLAALVGGAVPQLVLRLGYGAGRRPTPRRPVADVLD